MQKKLILLFSLFAFSLGAQNPDSIFLNKLYVGTVTEILDDITKEHQIVFKFNREKMSAIRYNDRPFNESLPHFLKFLCKELDLKYIRTKDGSIQLFGKYEKPEVEALQEPRKYTGGPKKKNLTVSGAITDINTGESLPFVSVRVAGAPVGTTANVDGLYTVLNVPSDTNTLIFNYLGYDPAVIYLMPGAPFEKMDITLTPSGSSLQEVVVTAEKEELLRASEQVSMLKMTPSKLSTLPSLGEKDIFRSFQLMPGISAANEHTSGLYVRGGTPDQALTLFDGFTVYNVDHLFGFFSAFNANAIKDVQLYKGVFDSKFGGRLSSVVEITGKDGNARNFNVGGNLSMLSANMWLEKPFGDKFTTIFSVRRSYKSALYNKIFDRYSGESETTANNPFGQTGSVASYFYDINGKATWKPNKRDVISLSFYNGADDLDNSIKPQLPAGLGGGGNSDFSINITDKTNWGNTGSSLKWSRRWNKQLYHNTLISYSNYYSKRDRSVNGKVDDGNGGETEINRGTFENNNLKDFSAKTDWEWQVFHSQKLEFGAFATLNDIAYSYAQNDTSTLLDRQTNGTTAGGYLQDKMTFFKERLQITPGIRITHFSPTGKVYYEPRANATITAYKQGNNNIKLKFATGRYYQFAKRVIREDVLSGSRDFWVLADNNRLPVSKSDQIVAGFSLENTGWLFDMEAYYKTLEGLSEYSLRFTPGFGTVSYDEFFYQGSGKAKGIDFLLQKKYGRLNGWIGYTIGEVRQNYPIYGEGDFYASNDVTHELKLVGLYKWRQWDFAATFIYASGKPYTAPEGGYQLTLLDGEDQSYLNVSSKNAYRLPDYYRTDVAATYNFRSGIGSIGASLFNVFNRQNVWYKNFEVVNNQVVETNVNYLGITPNISLNLKLR
jgi:ferric enterobactin receptor